MEKRNYQKGELNGPATISWPRYHHHDADRHSKDYCDNVLCDDHDGGDVPVDGDVFGIDPFIMGSIMRARKAKQEKKI